MARKVPHVVIRVYENEMRGDMRMIYGAKLITLTELPTKNEAKTEARRCAKEEDPGDYQVVSADHWHDAEWKHPKAGKAA